VKEISANFGNKSSEDILDYLQVFVASSLSGMDLEFLSPPKFLSSVKSWREFLDIIDKLNIYHSLPKSFLDLPWSESIPESIRKNIRTFEINLDSSKKILLSEIRKIEQYYLNSEVNPVILMSKSYARTENRGAVHLFVASEDINNALKSLGKFGYRGSYKSNTLETKLIHDSRKVSIVLRRQIFGNGLDSAVIRNATYFDFNGSTIQFLHISPEDQFLYIILNNTTKVELLLECVHALSKNRSMINWDNLVEKARVLGKSDALYSSFLKINTLFPGLLDQESLLKSAESVSWIRKRLIQLPISNGFSIQSNS